LIDDIIESFEILQQFAKPLSHELLALLGCPIQLLYGGLETVRNPT